MLRKVLIFSLLIFSSKKIAAQADTAAVRNAAQQMPYFASCEPLKNDDPAKRKCSDKALATFLAERLGGLDSAQRTGCSGGTVIISFVVDTSGKISADSVLRSPDPGCGKTARALLRAMPRWEPARESGRPVRVRLTLPIRFSAPAKAFSTEEYNIHWGKIRGDKVLKTNLLANLDEQLYVRDAFGNAVPILTLEFIFENGNKHRAAETAGAKPDKKMRKLAQKTAPGGTFTVVATVQHEGRLLPVSKSFLIED